MIIYKYPLAVCYKQELIIPSTHKILSAQVQHDVVCIWAAVDPSSPTVAKTILICGTGHQVPTGAYFIGTVQTGNYVWHIFEEA